MKQTATDAAPPSGGADPRSGRTDRTQRRHWGLQVQFQVALGAVFLLFCVLTAWLIYRHERELLEQTAISKSDLVMAAVDATRTYVQDTLRPKMYEVAGEDAFVLEAMSTSYITRAVMDRFKEALPEYDYRRVAGNARNPGSTPTPMEWELIDYFKAHPDQDRWQGIRSADGAMGFVHARPVYMDGSCLKCHGRPEDAPESLIEQYGDRNGFGYTEGQLAGVMAVSIPVHVALAKIRSQAMSVFWVTLILLTLLYVLISFLFNRMVVRSLRGLLDIFRSGLVAEDEMRFLVDANREDEIEELTQSARALTDHLAKARESLARYTGDLEQRVAERTRDLEASRQRLREKVTARDRELQTLNRISELITTSFRLADILPAVLEETLRLIPSEGAGIYLLQREEEEARLVLECQRNADGLAPAVPPNPGQSSHGAAESLAGAMWRAAGGGMSQFSCTRDRNCLNVPLVCRDRVLGVMTFVGVDFEEASSEMQSLLLSIGQQVGITVESLENVAALLQSKELLQTVFDGIPDIMVLLDKDLTIRMVNRAYLERHGVGVEETVGRRCRAQNGECDCFLAGTRLETVFATRRQTKEEVQNELGEMFLLYYYPILDESGEIWGILRYAKDITLEKKVEQRIQQTEKLAAIGQLAAGVAHEINNPIGIIRCYSELLRRQIPDTEPFRKDVEVIEKQALNCQRIVSDLLNFARSRESRRQDVQINEAVQEVVGMVLQQFRKGGTDVEVELAEGLPRVHVDPDQMKQVFLNLLINANQAVSNPGGRIRIRTARGGADDAVFISVTDNGSGVAPEIGEKIFDPFFSTKETGEGTGLGLSVSYGIVEHHGGSIRFRSTPVGETEFTVVLPAAAGAGERP